MTTKMKGQGFMVCQVLHEQMVASSSKEAHSHARQFCSIHISSSTSAVRVSTSWAASQNWHGGISCPHYSEMKLLPDLTHGKRDVSGPPACTQKPSAVQWPTSTSLATEVGCLELNERPKNLKIWRITREMRLSQVLILSICPILYAKMRSLLHYVLQVFFLVWICSQPFSICHLSVFSYHKFQHWKMTHHWKTKQYE